MELGGNAPFVVLHDADLEAAVEGAMPARFRGGRQACTAANRVLVHADVAKPVTTWESRSDLRDAINATEQGLAAYIYSRDLQTALKLAEHSEFGMVAVNRGSIADPSSPFGGMKQAGLGREGARQGMAEFQETQFFSLDWSG